MIKVFVQAKDSMKHLGSFHWDIAPVRTVEFENREEVAKWARKTVSVFPDLELRLSYPGDDWNEKETPAQEMASRLSGSYHSTISG